MRMILAALVAALSFVATLSLAALPLGNAAVAQSMCGPHDVLVAELGERYGEAVVFEGRHERLPQIYELLLNPETGTFTVLISDPERSCVTAAGIAGAARGFVAPPLGDPS
jgi:hypothetical protein